MTTDLLSSDSLRQIQAKHLHTLEQWAGRQGTVAGVRIVQCFNYDLIQATNQHYLRWAIETTNKADQLAGATNPGNGD